jgi:hypothetical protein
MARARDDDYEDDDAPPARRGRRDDDDYEDDDDRPSRRGGEKGPLDNMFANTNIVVLVLFACCCGLIAVVLALVEYLTGKDPKGKSNAMIVMIVSGILTVVGIIAQIAGGLAGGFQGPPGR